MRRLKQVICLLAGALLLGCASCGSSGDPTQIAEAYARQPSVTCTASYQVTLDAVIDGKEIQGLEQVFAADAQVDLTGGRAVLQGELVTRSGTTTLGSSQVEVYVLPEDGETWSFFRCGASYHAESQPYELLTVINAPLSLQLDSGYTKQQATEILNGTECDIYTGQELADDSQNILIGLSGESFSLDGCVMEVTLKACAATSLPAQLVVEYTNLEEMDKSFTDSQGNRYTITGLRCEVLYSSYGAEAAAEMPDGFRAAALSGQTGEAPYQISDHAPDASLEELLGGTVSGYTGDRDADFSDSYFIFNDDSSYFYAVNAPEYTALDEQTRDQVSFSYFYTENDFELITYRLCGNYTGEDEKDYAESLPSLYRSQSGISGVSSGGLQSANVGNYAVNYNIVCFTLEVDGQRYDAADLFSWTELPDGLGCLEVSVTEYNGTGDGSFFNAAEELEYAYSAILGGGAFRAD